MLRGGECCSERRVVTILEICQWPIQNHAADSEYPVAVYSKQEWQQDIPIPHLRPFVAVLFQRFRLSAAWSSTVYDIKLLEAMNGRVVEGSPCTSEEYLDFFSAHMQPVRTKSLQ